MARTSTETSDVGKVIYPIVRLVNMESAFLSLIVYIIKDIIIVIPFGIGTDPITVCNGKSMILSFKIIGHGVTFWVKADGISRPHE